MALAYVGRYATTRAKLVAYCERKLRERGWAGDGAPDPRALAERLAKAGMIDDAAFAVMKAQSLERRGYGRRRVATALHAAGIEEADRHDALADADRASVEVALRFAERRRFGPFASDPPTDRKARDRQVAAMVRAGHPIGLAVRIIALPPGAAPDAYDLVSATSRTAE
jgi:regulatory protein